MTEAPKIINSNTENELWEQVAADFEGKEILDYDAVLQQSGYPNVLLEVEIDMGGGFEGGYAWTRFSAPVQVQDNFRFALHHESFLDKAGKFFGLEDKVLGFVEFDKEFIIKTNDEEKVKHAFEDESVRSFFNTLKDFDLHISHFENGEHRLILEIEEGITDVTELKSIYDAFCKVLMQLQAPA